MMCLKPKQENNNDISSAFFDMNPSQLLRKFSLKSPKIRIPVYLFIRFPISSNFILKCELISKLVLGEL
jgi:hypothetical protein